MEDKPNRNRPLKKYVRDDVEFNAEQLIAAQAKVAQDNELISSTNLHWENFYSTHQNKFFKDRNWIGLEIPELLALRSQDDLFRVLEVGCGVGNTVFPILSASKHSYVYCCDYSSSAIELLKKNPLFNSERCFPFVCDLTDPSFNYPIAPESLDLITCIFVISSIPPLNHKLSIRNFYKLLKPGGLLFFRDYGLYDLTQLRFNSSRCVDHRLYARGDSTLVYYLTLEDVESLFVTEGFQKIYNRYDRRLLINRSNKKKMFRVWIQSKFQKPSPII